MPLFRTRRFEAADERELNETYVALMRHHMPRFSRSLDVMRWLWYQAPGGPMESWVVEAQEPGGPWRIVGHHGICPIRCTLGERDLRCAKTNNTFLLPQYRSKFLYIRFEQQCLAEVRSRYHLIYSYGNQVSRLRKPLGYDAGEPWIWLEHGSRYLDFATCMFARIVNRYPRAPWTQIAHAWAKACVSMARKPDFEWTELTAREAMDSVFFADFWQQARFEAGMSPRRDVEDLAWRYWLRPDSSFVTLVKSWDSGARAYCIVDTTQPFIYRLCDIFVTPMRPDLLEATLNTLFYWCARRGALTMLFNTASRGQAPQLMQVFFEHMRLAVMSRFRKQSQFSCYVSPKGEAEIGTPLPRWNTTELLTPS